MSLEEMVRSLAVGEDESRWLLEQIRAFADECREEEGAELSTMSHERLMIRRSEQDEIPDVVEVGRWTFDSQLGPSPEGRIYLYGFNCDVNVAKRWEKMRKRILQ